MEDTLKKEIIEEFENSFIKMSPGRDMKNRPPLYDTNTEDVDEICSFLYQVIDRTRRDERNRIIDKLPKEKPMTVFSFVLREEELDRYMKYKGFNQCLGEIKDIINPSPKE